MKNTKCLPANETEASPGTAVLDRGYRRGKASGTIIQKLLPLMFLVLSACSQPEVQPRTAERGEIETAGGLSYDEPYRPQFHFSPPAQWMNDPNGMVFFNGEYHLFYQYYPEDTVWGPMHWGHAVSSDMVHWKHLPIALYPDEKGYTFSGSAVVDWRNTSGFGSDGKPPLVAIFTYHAPGKWWAGKKSLETQGIAYSNDRGRSWTKFEGNPVLPNTKKLRDFRDPKVFWHEGTQRWVMVVSANDHVQFWASPDLKQWSHLSDFGHGLGAQDGTWECPDLVEMTVEGSGETRWVLIQNINPGGPHGGSGVQYFVGDFDGQHFSLDASFEKTLAEEGAVWLDTGRDNYAGVTWSDIPDDDGRTLFIGWMSNWEYAQSVPTHPWRSAMTIPRQLVLTRTDQDGYRVYSRAVTELQTLRGTSRKIEPARIKAGSEFILLADAPLMQSEWKLDLELPDSVTFDIGFELKNDLGERYRFGLDGAKGELYSDRRASGDSRFSAKFPGVHRAARLSESRRLELHIFVDAASVETFTDNGANVFTDTVFPSSPFTQLSVYAERADLHMNGGQTWELNRIWD